MARRKPRTKPLGTTGEVPDELWERSEPTLKELVAFVRQLSQPELAPTVVPPPDL